MNHEGAPKKRWKKLLLARAKTLTQVHTDFCKSTSAHGFQYWVSAGSFFERMFWVGIVATGFTFASIMIYSTVCHWMNNPRTVAIQTFSKPSHEVEFPAITICNEDGFDVGEYIRAVFDNFQYSCFKGHNCSETELLRSHFPGHFDWNWKYEMLREIAHFPHPSSPKIWETDEIPRLTGVNFCNRMRSSLLPHFFNPNHDDLQHEKIITDLLSGVYNDEEWYQNIGLKITRQYYWTQTQQFTIHPPHRYLELFEVADKDHEFWKLLASCYDNEGANGIFGNKSCEGFYNDKSETGGIFASLSSFDIFVFGKLQHLHGTEDVIKRLDYNDNMRWVDGDAIWPFEELATEYCRNGSWCDIDEIEEKLSNVVAQLMLMNGYYLILI